MRRCRLFVWLLCLCGLLLSCSDHTPVSSLDRALAQADSLVLAHGGPLSRIAVTSATQVGFLYALDRLDAVCASSTPERMFHLPASTPHLGEDFQLNIESLLLIHPDVLLLTDYGFDVPGVDRVLSAGIPVLYLREWRESSPLARTEWIRVLARLTGENHRADSLLTLVRHRYDSIASLSTSVLDNQRPAVVSGMSYRGTWYVPTGATYMGQLFAAAGARYAYADRSETESLPLSIEQVLLTFSEADVWLGAEASSLAELTDIDPRHAWIKACRDGRVFNWRRAQLPSGANDFWEQGVVRPDWILEDLRSVLYPQSADSISATTTSTPFSATASSSPHFILPLR